MATFDYKADHEKGDSSPSDDSKTSSSSSSSDSTSDSGSTEKTSPSTTPPRQDAVPVVNPSLGPRVNHDASYSATPPRRGRRNGPRRTTGRLGVIDEHSNSIAPDIPGRNPQRKHYKYGNATKFFTWAAYSRSDPNVPPVNAYDNITGPRGEKFGDLRQNKPFRPPHRGGWRRLICLGSIALAILLAIALGVGLGVGLTRKKQNSSQNIDNPASSGSSDEDPEPFPIATWLIPTFLTTTTTNCTSNPSTWRCYPYTTYSPISPTSSFSTLTFRITSPTNSTLDLLISNANPVFSYPFTNVPLSVVDTNDPRLSAFAFSFAYRKQVVPTTDITGDGGATRCYYNDTILSVRLYDNVQGAGGDITASPNNGTAMAGQSITTTSWPFAIEYQERITSGPECFRYVNGRETDMVTVDAGSGECECGYRNFGL